MKLFKKNNKEFAVTSSITPYYNLYSKKIFYRLNIFLISEKDSVVIDAYERSGIGSFVSAEKFANAGIEKLIENANNDKGIFTGVNEMTWNI